MNIDIKTLPYNSHIEKLMFEGKNNELLQVATKYNLSLDELKNTLSKELYESGMKVGACNTAIDFLIIETLDKNKKYKSIKDGIKSNILMAATYYVNGIGKSEYV